MAEQAKLTRRSVGTAGYWAAALDPDRKRLYCGATDATVHVYDIARPGEPPVAALGGHSSYVTAVAFSRSAAMLLSAGYDRRLVGRRPDQGEPVWTVSLNAPAKCLTVSPDGTQAAAALDDLRIGIWEVATGKPIRLLEGQHAPRTEIGRPSTVYAVAWSPDGALLASGDRTGQICLWEGVSGRFVARLDAGSLYSQALYRNKLGGSEYEWGGVRSLCFSPDGRLLFAGGMGPADQNSAGLDGLMEILAFEVGARKGVARAPVEKGKGVLYALTTLPGGRWVLGGGGGGGAGNGGSGLLCLWAHAARDSGGKPVSPVMFPSAMVGRDLVLAPDGKQAFLVGMEKSVTAGRLEWWDLSPGA